LCHCNYTYEGLLFIQLSRPNTKALLHCLGKNAVPFAQCCSAKRLTAGLYHCSYTYENLLFIQLSSDPTPRHCCIALGKMQAPLFSAALQHSLTAGLCHCNYTYEGLLFIQLSNALAPIHCSTALGKMQAPLLSAALQKGSQQACATAITFRSCSCWDCLVRTSASCFSFFGRALSLPILQQSLSFHHPLSKTSRYVEHSNLAAFVAAVLCLPHETWLVQSLPSQVREYPFCAEFQMHGLSKLQ